MYQGKKEEIRRVHAAPTNNVNSLSSEEIHFIETCCRILGVDCRDQKEQMGAEHVNEGKGAREKSSR
jgi:hypothetical protein